MILVEEQTFKNIDCDRSVTENITNFLLSFIDRRNNIVVVIIV